MHSLPQPKNYISHRADIDQEPDGKFDAPVLHPRDDSDKEVSGVADLEGDTALPRFIVTPEGTTEYFVDRIVGERKKGRGKQYRVRWAGYGPDDDTWEARSELVNTAALEEWENTDGEDESAESDADTPP